MNRLTTGAIFAGAIAVAASSQAVAAHVTALAKVAADLGYVYSYLGPEDAVALTRPGVTVVIRPGERLFDVNDRTEAVGGPAPRFDRNDFFISDELVARLRVLAQRYPVTPAVSNATGVSNGSRPAETSRVTGAITDLTIVQVPGQQVLSVGGKAPANLPITLTLIETFASELPDVVLNRHAVTVDPQGTFRASVPIAPGYYRGALLTLVASSLPGVSSAKAQIQAAAPNDKAAIPGDRSRI